MKVVVHLDYIEAVIGFTERTDDTRLCPQSFHFALYTKNPNEEHSYPPCLVNWLPNPVQSPTSAVCASALADADGSLRAGVSACVVHDCPL